MPDACRAAQHLLRSLGFREITPYYDNPLPGVTMLELHSGALPGPLEGGERTPSIHPTHGRGGAGEVRCPGDALCGRHLAIESEAATSLQDSSSMRSAAASRRPGYIPVGAPTGAGPGIEHAIARTRKRQGRSGCNRPYGRPFSLRRAWPRGGTPTEIVVPPRGVYPLSARAAPAQPSRAAICGPGARPSGPRAPDGP